ncbi:PEGA domain-containing protein [Pontiella sulfatireligans]|uniref:PEGA domain-containing protein n=1 Tax=Pontiella sulfatireligans TaxID=2750658 RepID=A0A6C2UJW6_9BACT|nr:PEGA domain-containing protein [Pontiella sulfatireligans]VGO20173.1 hypothetical protein SCARR_02234 [Pontiella sulfatireligans]
MNAKTMFKIAAATGLAALFTLSGCAPVTVSSTPRGARVYYKGSDKLVGSTPAKVNLYANAKEMVVRKDGYFSQTVVLSPIDPKNVSVELQRREKVLLLSHPNGAQLFVEGQEKRVGLTPFVLNYDKPYRTFEVRAPGYETQKYTIPEDPEGNVVVELVRQASVMLTSKPKNVDVFDRDGQKLGVTPYPVPAVAVGQFELRKEGYYNKDVAVGPETASPMVVELEREPIIIVYSEPEDAIVVHRGVTLGKTPFRHLVKEDMELEISADRYYTQKVTIAPDSPRKVSVALKPKPYINVMSSPKGAELYRSGGVELIGKEPVEVLVEKDTAYEMHLPGHEIKPFMLSSDSSHTVIVPLVKSAVGLAKTVVIDSQPSGALVYRPGGAEFIGKTPLEQRVESERTFELQLEGFITKIVTVAPDSADSVKFALARDESTGNVTISDPLLNTPSSF